MLTERVFYTEEEIAKALGTTKSYISKILLGKIRSEKYCIEKLPTTKIKVPKNKSKKQITNLMEALEKSLKK